MSGEPEKQEGPILQPGNSQQVLQIAVAIYQAAQSGQLSDQRLATHLGMLAHGYIVLHDQHKKMIEKQEQMYKRFWDVQEHFVNVAKDVQLTENRKGSFKDGFEAGKNKVVEAISGIVTVIKE